MYTLRRAEPLICTRYIEKNDHRLYSGLFLGIEVPIGVAKIIKYLASTYSIHSARVLKAAIEITCTHSLFKITFCCQSANFQIHYF